MPESTLSLARHDYRAEVGVWLGYGRGDEDGNTDPAWTSSQEAAVNLAVSAGQRQFYFPPPLPGERFPHEWSFLKPVGSVTLAEGDAEVELPDDFGGFDGPVTMTVSGSTVARELDLMGEGIVRRKRAEAPDTSGIPVMVALVPIKGVGVNEGQRFKLTVWPEADDAYVLSFPYTILPDAITGAKPYSYGGMQHVETVLASCLERAEFYKDNMQGGPCFMNFVNRLAASIGIDRRMRPVTVGRTGGNRAGSDYEQSVTFYGLDADDI